MEENKREIPSWVKLLIKMFLTAIVLYVSFYLGIIFLLAMGMYGIHVYIAIAGMFVFPALILPQIWTKKRKKALIGGLIFTMLYAVVFGINFGMIKYEESITIDTSPNINVYEYLPFDEGSKIVTLDHEASLKLESNLPIIDGAAALFPVYSAFVNATYPNTVELYDDTFLYNNTPVGYMCLAEKSTDIFIGVYPSEDQIQYAKEQGTEWIYTPIGQEAFVFFVHKDNPIESLTTEQIQGIYSGEITNWKEVGGKDEAIAAYQRNQGSGSQSMLERFMGDKEIMEAPTEMVNDLMLGIIEQVSDYKSKDNSIGFSFRYYVEGVIQNPDIKLIRIDGVAPTVENIKSGDYPVVTPIYAVTYEGNENENVDKLLQWILSDEGQEIIEKTGYASISE